MQKTRLKSRQAQLKLEMIRLRQQAKAVFSPATFAKSAKLERQANAIEKSLKEVGFPDRRVAAAGTAAKVGQVRVAQLQPGGRRKQGMRLALEQCSVTGTCAALALLVLQQPPLGTAIATVRRRADRGSANNGGGARATPALLPWRCSKLQHH
jgi:hypothetical protein